jgi:hypothetical protein
MTNDEFLARFGTLAKVPNGAAKRGQQAAPCFKATLG